VVNIFLGAIIIARTSKELLKNTLKCNNRMIKTIRRNNKIRRKTN